MQTTLQLIKTYSKGWRMNFLEKFYIQQYQFQDTLIDEQKYR